MAARTAIGGTGTLGAPRTTAAMESCGIPGPRPRGMAGSIAAAVCWLLLVGCGSVSTDASEHPPAPPAPPLHAPESVASVSQETPWEELLQQLKGRQGKLAIAGGSAFIVFLIVAVGVGKILRGTPRPAEARERSGPA